jgi:hypothetical protein
VRYLPAIPQDGPIRQQTGRFFLACQLPLAPPPLVAVAARTGIAAPPKPYRFQGDPE